MITQKIEKPFVFFPKSQFPKPFPFSTSQQKKSKLSKQVQKINMSEKGTF
jgi:hypothetical protein